MIVNLQSLSNHLDHALEQGNFPIFYPEFLVRSQIAVAERLEAILGSLEVQRLSYPPCREKPQNLILEPLELIESR